jgi:hypothetical protein
LICPLANAPLQPVVSVLSQILKPNTTTTPKPLAGLCHTPQELGMVLQSIVQPIVLALEPNQHACWFPVPGDQDLLGLR